MLNSFTDKKLKSNKRSKSKSSNLNKDLVAKALAQTDEQKINTVLKTITSFNNDYQKFDFAYHNDSIPVKVREQLLQVYNLVQPKTDNFEFVMENLFAQCLNSANDQAYGGIGVSFITYLFAFEFENINNIECLAVRMYRESINSNKLIKPNTKLIEDPCSVCEFLATFNEKQGLFNPVDEKELFIPSNKKKCIIS